MKIAAIRTTPLALAFREPYHWAGRVDHAGAVVLVEVTTDDGLTGVGESVAAFPAEGTVAALQGVAPSFVGQPVFDIERLVTQARHLGSFNHTPWYANFVLAGLEMALWDILGQAAGWPVYRLLGGAVRDQVDYFGFVQGDTTDELVEDARDLAAAGHGVIYLKVGRGTDADLRNTAAVRAVIGDRLLRLDPNCAWSVAEAIHMIGRLRPFDPDWIEQPTPLQSIAALRQVKEAVDVPIAADQAVFTPADVFEICRQRAADAIVLSPHEAGGLLAFGKAAAIAEAAGVPALIGSVRFDANQRPRNSLIALLNAGPPAALYDKWHLVPFGEYEPDWMPQSFQLVPGGGFASGPGPRTLHVPTLPAVGPLICYEAIFPGVVIDARDRPDWMVNVTNDAWFGNSTGPRQHLAAARLRAVEEGLPLMRAANTGISAAFDAFGREQARLGMNQTGVLVTSLPGHLPPTPFARFGLAIPGLLAGLLAGASWFWPPRRRQK